MPLSPAIKLTEAYREKSRIYFRVFVDNDEKPSLVFASLINWDAFGDAGIKTWCEQHLNKLDSGAIAEATFD